MSPDIQAARVQPSQHECEAGSTRLFFERGLDQVTVDEIAEAADAGRMTVFNHFPRKEDLFFDREQEIRNVAFEAVQKRGSGMTPVDASRQLAHHLIICI